MLLLVAAACAGGSSSQPGSVAFELQIVRTAPCGSSTCVDVVITNGGSETGSGSCQLIGLLPGTPGYEPITEGPTIVVTDLTPGVELPRRVRWSGWASAHDVRGICDPPPGS